MILEAVVLDVRPDHAERFENAFDKAQNIIAAARGYEGHELRKSADRENRYLLLVWWDSIESHTVGFRTSPQYQEWKRLLHHFYDPFPQVEHYLPAPAARRTQRLWIMVSGPNLQALNDAALAILNKGHVPVIGANMALPVIGQGGPEVFNAVMMPLSRSLAERCDAVLRIDGASRRADEEVEVFRRKGLPIFGSLDEIPKQD